MSSACTHETMAGSTQVQNNLRLFIFLQVLGDEDGMLIETWLAGRERMRALWAWLGNLRLPTIQ